MCISGEYGCEYWIQNLSQKLKLILHKTSIFREHRYHNLQSDYGTKLSNPAYRHTVKLIIYTSAQIDGIIPLSYLDIA